jgi:CRP-like cAMP-binding protein
MSSIEDYQESTEYRLWGVDDIVYGPVDESTFREWIRDERVAALSWVFLEASQEWRRAVEAPALKPLFPDIGHAADNSAPSNGPAAIKPGALRRVKILSALSDNALERLIRHLDVVPAAQFSEVVRKGETGDALYMVLEGELRVRLMIGGKETALMALGPGDVFGEISVFDQGPRSADVVANTDSVLVRLSEAAVRNLLVKAPELIAPILFSLGKTLAARIRADNKRLQDSVVMARAASGLY